MSTYVQCINILKIIYCQFLKCIESENRFHNIFEIVNTMTSDLDMEIKIPKLANRQTNRSNYNTSTIEKYHRISLFLSYLDSVIISLKSRFTQNNDIPFKLSNLRPLE